MIFSFRFNRSRSDFRPRWPTPSDTKCCPSTTWGTRSRTLERRRWGVTARGRFFVKVYFPEQLFSFRSVSNDSEQHMSWSVLIGFLGVARHGATQKHCSSKWTFKGGLAETLGLHYRFFFPVGLGGQLSLNRFQNFMNSKLDCINRF
jgi:hypothetical protein